MLALIPIASLVIVGVIATTNHSKVKSVKLRLSGLTITFYKTNSGKKRN